MDSIYVGAFNILTGACDMKIDFYKTEPVVNEDGNVIGEERSEARRITMNLPLAKQFAQTITELIEHYEANMAPIIELSALGVKREEEGNV